jgi:hypothetical protein
MTPADYARMIPPDVVEAAAEDIYNHWQFSFTGKVPWVKSGNSLMQEKARDLARAALAAGLAVWPNLKLDPSWDLRTHKRRVALKLPAMDAEPINVRSAHYPIVQHDITAAPFICPVDLVHCQEVVAIDKTREIWCVHLQWPI